MIIKKRYLTVIDKNPTQSGHHQKKGDYDDIGDSYVNMNTNGMLAIWGDADDSITDFLNLVSGADAIRYWDGLAWAHITNAVAGQDYSLAYYDTGDLAGHTVLTVVPEPATMSLLALGGLTVLGRKRK